jgi:formate hydrogenlyase transcriptional activator
VTVTLSPANKKATDTLKPLVIYITEREDLTAEAYEIAKKQRAEIIRVLSACKGRVGGADGAAARRGMNRTTLLSRMNRFGICAKQYA